MKNRIYFFSLLIIFLVSCSRSTSSLIDSDKCKAPCWRGMTPGITTKEDAKKLLLEMDDVDKKTITEIPGNNYWQNGLKWSFINVVENNGALYFHDDKLIILFTNYDDKLTLSKVISKFDNPDEVYAKRMVLDGTMVTFNLLYSSGICVEVNTLGIKPKEVRSKNGQYSAYIEPSEKIKYIYYFDSNLSADEINTTCYWQYEQDIIQEWKGYGDYIFFTE